MKKFVIASLALVAFAAPAIAADMPVKAPIAVVPYSWTGWYIGANAGYSWGKDDITYSQAGAGGGFGSGQCTTACSLPFTTDPKSALVGGQLGYNYQMGMWVFGAEADIQWRNHQETTGLVFSGFADTLTLTDNQKWFGTVRGRVGLTPSASNWLFYVTGGLAYGRFDHTVVQSFNPGGGPPSFITQTTSTSPTKAGWALGAGVEYALNQRWSLGAEYLYMNFGNDTVNALTPVTGGASSTTFKDVSQVARVKLNYKFLP